MSVTYQDVFGGANIYPSEISYSAVALTANTTFSWPDETAQSENLITRIMNVTASSGPFSITMPDATQAGVGETVLFNNVGSYSFLVKDADGTQIVSVAAGEVWQVYLTNNSTNQGAWSSLQYGAAVSSANASALAGTGIVAVGSLLSQSVPVTSFSVDYTAGSTDRAKMYVWTAAAGTLTLPDCATVGSNWFMYVRNAGTGALTVDPDGSNQINGASTLTMNPLDSAIIATDGSAYYTIGLGKTTTFAFDYTSISVAGTGTYTLAGSELNRIVYHFTGVLTGNREIVVPATVQQYWVANFTTGSYTLKVKTAAGAGEFVGQNARAILYCDGTDVVDADTSTVSTPISIANGGTGAVTAGAALIALGGTAVGTALFTAASEAAAWVALGVAQSGVVDGGTF